MSDPTVERKPGRQVSIRAEQSTESAASTSVTSGARSLASSRSFGRRTSEKFFNIAVAGLAKAQVNEQKAVNGKGRRKKSARDPGHEARLRRLVDEWWRILDTVEEGPVRLSQFVKLWEIFGGKPFNTEQRNVLMRAFRCKNNNVDREISFQQFEAFCLHQLAVQREMRKQGQASSLTSDDYTIMGLMPIQTIFLAAKRNLVMLSFFSGNFDSDDLSWQMPDHFLEHNRSRLARGIKASRGSLVASSWKAAALVALEKERSSQLDARRGRGNALRIGRAPNVSAQTTLAEEQWPELPRVLTQLQEMPYASPASSVSVTGDEPNGTDAVGPGDVKEWRPKLRGYRPFSCSAIRADVRTDDFFTKIAPVLERAGARVEMTSPLRHSKDVANRARSAVSSLRRDGHYNRPATSLGNICRPGLSAGRRSLPACSSSQSIMTSSLRNSWAPSGSTKTRPATVPARTPRDMTVSHIAAPTSVRASPTAPLVNAKRDSGGESSGATRRPGTSPVVPSRSPSEKATTSLFSHHRHVRTRQASRQPSGDEWTENSGSFGVRPGTAPVRSRGTVSAREQDEEALGWAPGLGVMVGENQSMVAIPEIVSDNDSDDRDNAAERLDAEDSVASDGGTPTWMEWAKVHKAWAFVTQGAESNDDEIPRSHKSQDSDSDSLDVYTDDEDSWDGDTPGSPPLQQRPSTCNSPSSHEPPIASTEYPSGGGGAKVVGLGELRARAQTAEGASRPQVWVGPSIADKRFSRQSVQESLRNRVHEHIGRNICSGRYSGHRVAARENWSLNRRLNKSHERQSENTVGIKGSSRAKSPSQVEAELRSAEDLSSELRIDESSTAIS